MILAINEGKYRALGHPAPVACVLVLPGPRLTPRPQSRPQSGGSSAIKYKLSSADYPVQTIQRGNVVFDHTRLASAEERNQLEKSVRSIVATSPQILRIVRAIFLVCYLKSSA